uniref:Calmodulin-lysine N-methyltransferase n=1 Tax=Oncorhynchus tshawytscha TaxID=74940 RepID=A0A8C8LLL2_ONCTS
IDKPPYTYLPIWLHTCLLSHKCNSVNPYTQRVLMKWNCKTNVTALEGHFNIVMCADCLFLDQYRGSLVDAIRRLLRPDFSGTALVFAPIRRDTLGEFGQLVEGAGLQDCCNEKYDEQVWDLHLKVSETPGNGVLKVHYRLLYKEKGKLSSLLMWFEKVNVSLFVMVWQSEFTYDIRKSFKLMVEMVP